INVGGVGSRVENDQRRVHVTRSERSCRQQHSGHQQSCDYAVQILKHVSFYSLGFLRLVLWRHASSCACSLGNSICFIPAASSSQRRAWLLSLLSAAITPA